MPGISIYLVMGVVFAVSSAAAFILTGVAGGVGARLGLTDKPRPGEIQVRVVPRTGGYGIWLAFMLGLAVSLPLVERFPEEYPRLAGLVLGALVVIPVAVVDDLRRLSPLPQLGAQIVAALIPTLFGVTIVSISNPFGPAIVLPPALVVPVTVLWIVGMINTFNFLDTMDGLAGGISTIAALIFFMVSLSLGQSTIAVLSLALAGAALGFLPHNFNPARVFMGTSGSMFLGYALGVLAIIGGAKIATALLVLGLPIVDVALVIMQRVGRGRSPFRGGDSAHLPHRLLGAGMSQRGVALIFYALCAGFGWLATTLLRGEKVYAFAGLALVSLGFALWLRRGRAGGREAARPRPPAED